MISFSLSLQSVFVLPSSLKVRNFCFDILSWKFCLGGQHSILCWLKSLCACSPAFLHSVDLSGHASGGATWSVEMQPDLQLLQNKGWSSCSLCMISWSTEGTYQTDCLDQVAQKTLQTQTTHGVQGVPPVSLSSRKGKMTCTWDDLRWSHTDVISNYLP